MQLYSFLDEAVETDLPMDDASRMQRARELGFIIKAFHGTGVTFQAFDLNKGSAGTVNGPAPHFADNRAEAAGYAKQRAGKKGRVLDVLLRVKKPFVIDLNGPRQYLTKRDYRRMTGQPFQDKFETKPRTWKTMSDLEYGMARNPGMEFSSDDATNRRRWAEIYHRLSKAGYDAILWPETPADHSRMPYGKYIVFDPKNIRLMQAAFDPAQSESSDLMA